MQTCAVKKIDCIKERFAFVLSIVFLKIPFALLCRSAVQERFNDWICELFVSNFCNIKSAAKNR